ncbi:MAG: hydroxymethylglutaryl-CoA lyase, partial [Vulcanimicrobiaceae bacterium]
MTNLLGAVPKTVAICEVGPRDGLQNESGLVGTDDKVRYIEMLVAAGVRTIEAASFVHPKLVPQMADGDDVMRKLQRQPGVTYFALVPNDRGLARARAAGVRAIAVFTAASESFAKRNINLGIDESLAVFRGIVGGAKADGMRVKASISTSFGCPFEGHVPVESVVRVASALAELGADEISVADTIGVGTPNQVVEIVDALRAHVPLERVSLHFHDTRGTALANILAGLEAGIDKFDASSGGLGGCPFAPGATGNVATEDVLYLLHGMGIATGIDLEQLRDASR